MLPPIEERRQIGRRKSSPVPAVVNTYTVPEGGEHDHAEPAPVQTLAAFLWRRKAFLAAGAACGLLAGLAISLLMSPVYRARTSLQLESFNDHAFATPVSPVPNASPEDYLQNEVKVLESDTLARRVANQLGPARQTPPGPLHEVRLFLEEKFSFLFPYRDMRPLDSEDRRIEAIKKAITVRTALQSQVIDVLFDASDPVLAAKGANAAASEFINLNGDARSELVQNTTEWLNKQANELRAKLQSLNRQLQDFTVSSGLVVGPKEGSPAQDRLRQIQEGLTRAEADRAAKQARYEAAAANKGEVVSEALASGPLRQYQTELQTLRRQSADLRTIYTADDNRVARVEAQIAATEAAIERERTDIITRLRNDYLAAASLERTLSASLQNQTGAVGQQTRKQLQYEVLRNDADTTQKLYDSVLARAKEAGAASSLRVANIRVIDQASAPALPYSPDIPLNMALGLGLGTLGSAGLVLLGARSGKIKQPGELESMYVRELGVVPSAPKESAIVPRDWSVTPKGADELNSFLLRESFRAVLTSILLGTRPEHNGNGRRHNRILTVTSVAMMEGKTTIVTNLGLASAQMQRDVLLIDADLRRPRLHQRFGLANRAGLTDILQRPLTGRSIEKSSWESLVQATQIPHLWVLTAGPTDASSAGLLYSADLDEVLQHFASRFELIFIDTPPLSMYPDARILGEIADGMVMVVRANRNNREDVRAIYQQLLQDRIHVLGTILNDWKVDRSQARAYNNYYHHYEHHNDAAD
jgi:succinoglycan biosynthesis transport protein ExoP